MSGPDRRDAPPAGTGADASGNAAPPSRVRLRILDKEVQLACPPEEEEQLRRAAAYVDRAMRETRQRNTTSSLEKIAIVTAINTASSLLDARSRAGDDGDAARRVARLNARLDGLLTDGDEAVTPERARTAGGTEAADEGAGSASVRAIGSSADDSAGRDPDASQDVPA